MTERTDTVDHYGANYEQFASELYAEIRAAAFGEDIGQNGWLTVDEQDLFISWLQLSAGQRLIDVACGSGGPTLRIARVTGCHVHGVDIHKDAVATARAQAQEWGLHERASFEQADVSQGLDLADGSVDGVICIEAAWTELPDAAAPIEGSMALLERLHERWVYLWRCLADPDWVRRLRHPDLGEMRVDELLAFYAWHGKHHVAHITTLREREGW